MEEGARQEEEEERRGSGEGKEEKEEADLVDGDGKQVGKGGSQGKADGLLQIRHLRLEGPVPWLGPRVPLPQEPPGGHCPHLRGSGDRHFQRHCLYFMPLLPAGRPLALLSKQQPRKGRISSAKPCNKP